MPGDTSVNVFLDTNVYLSFYRYTSDDLEALRQFAVLAKGKRATLWLPEQLEDEFWRNRDSVIHVAVRDLEKASVKSRFPRLCSGYDELKKLQRSAATFARSQAELVRRIRSDAGKHALPADKAVAELFAATSSLETDEAILERASLRARLGRPPGKPGSLGDAVNWECLLEHVPDGEELCFVSGDGDYTTPLAPGELSPYLAAEWQRAKGSSVAFYGRLTAFLEERFPEISLADELERDLLVEDLESSPNFASTRKTLRQLRRHNEFSDDQLRRMVAAAVSNNQIYWIASDRDINRHLGRIVDLAESRIDSPELEELQLLLIEAAEQGQGQ